ncbi:hypothetical protein R80B4_02639 [Fibrobacteres bacterium R8-0-B4]
MPYFSSVRRATACTSSPMRPTGQVEHIIMHLGLNIAIASSMAFSNFFSPPKTMSCSWRSVEKEWGTEFLWGVSSGLALLRRVPQL